MEKVKKQQGSIIAIITMMFLYAMISFVTNLAAPIGVIWKGAFQGESANVVGMLGNAMNFLAYLFMGIPAGDDIMLNYQTTGYHDNQSLRELFGKQPIKEFKEWLVKYGFMTEDGKLTEKAGDPSVFLK